MSCQSLNFIPFETKSLNVDVYRNVVKLKSIVNVSVILGKRVSHHTSIPWRNIPLRSIQISNVQKISSRRSTSVGMSVSSSSVSGQNVAVVPKKEINDLIEYLKADLPRLFDKGEVDRTKFEEKMNFEDPITKYDSLSGYLFNIKMLLVLFQPIFELHKTYQSAPNEITTRWTMTMDFKILPWRPQIVFTGLSIYGINPATGKFNSHTDVWDSISDQRYLSVEGLKDLISQSSLFYTKLGHLSPRYNILKRTKYYEVRHYAEYTAAEIAFPPENHPIKSAVAELGKLKNALSSKGVECGTPAVIVTDGSQSEAVLLRLPIAANQASKLKTQNGTGTVRVAVVPPQVMAAVRFGGEVTDKAIVDKEGELRINLIQDSLDIEAQGKAVALYNEWSLVPSLNRNEIMVAIKDFSLDAS